MNWRALSRIAVLLATAGFLTACGERGSSGNDCTAFGQQNCMGANNAGCYQGTCQCCWGVQSGSTFQCYGCNVAACAARGYGCSADGKCVFPPPPAGPSCSSSSSTTGASDGGSPDGGGRCLSPSSFPCGSYTCSAPSQYCFVHVVGSSSSYSCTATPTDTCGCTSNCSCVGAHILYTCRNGTSCNDPGGQVTFTCRD